MMATDAVNKYWLWGGGLLVGSAVVSFAPTSILPWPGYLGQLALVVGVLLFAFGGGVSRNLFHGGRLGTVSLVLYAAWEVVTTVIREIPIGTVADNTPGVVFGTVQSFVTIAISIILVVQIGRAEHLPKPWRWAPLWAVVAQTAVGLLTHTVIGSAPANGPAFQAVIALSAIVGAAVPIFLGILGIVLAQSWPSSASSVSAPSSASTSAAANSA